MSEPTPSRWLTGDDVLRDALVCELLEARLVAVFATFDPAGLIHAVPMWYAARGEEVILATSSRSRKVHNLERDRRATLVLHDSRPGYEVCGASIAGTVEVVRADDAGALIDLVHARYITPEGARDLAVQMFLESDDIALRFHPERSLTWDERGSEASSVLRARGGALPLLPTEPRA